MCRRVTGTLIVLLAMAWTSGSAEAGTTYIVRAGDTLWRISHRFGVLPAVLAAANHLTLTDTIRPGLRLAVPGTAGTAAEDAEHGPRVPPSPEPAAASFTARASAFSAAAVHAAMQFLGRPYQWSGIGSGGFDCSGLIVRIFAALGRVLPHSSYAQFEAGVGVPRWALAPGDLVFFRTYGAGASHVGLYVGDSRFVHASYSRGVILSSIEEPYFRDRFVGARRL